MLPLAFATAALLTLPMQAAANQTAAGTQTKTPSPVTQPAKANVETWTGWITDNCDGVHGASVDNTKAKVQGCKERGGRVVFYNLANKRFYDLDKIDLALDNVGHPVTVTGVRDWNLIKVETIVPKPS
jgi:hypothetical protein